MTEKAKAHLEYRDESTLIGGYTWTAVFDDRVYDMNQQDTIHSRVYGSPDSALEEWSRKDLIRAMDGLRVDGEIPLHRGETIVAHRRVTA